MNSKNNNYQSDEQPYDIEQIEESRKNSFIGHKVILFKSTASTNDIAWKYADNSSNDGLCVLAESQTKGRGRRGRTWHSEPGQSILASVLLLNQPQPAELLTLTAAVATADAIQAFCGTASRIKWPNDILINGKKVAGILVEKKTIRQQHRFVIGIGINANQPASFFNQYEMNVPPTSLAIETGQPIDRTGLICTLLTVFEQWLGKSRHNHSVIARWQQLSDLLGRHLTIESDNHRYKGFCRGIDPAEGLIVHLDNGAVRIFHAGQTSIIEVQK